MLVGVATSQSDNILFASSFASSHTTESPSWSPAMMSAPRVMRS
jgi:hypothetical protein